MKKATQTGFLYALQNLCPSCGQGEVFYGFVSMHNQCPKCACPFYPEPGFYIGALFIQYTATAFAILPTILVGAFLSASKGPGSLIWAGVLCSAQVLLLSPIFYRYGRLLWLHANFNRQ